MGTQDDFGQAQGFINDDALGSEITFLWDPTFDTWSFFGVRVNSQMAILSSDLGTASSLFFGFGEAEQAEVLRLLADFA